jgi:hypothetical protein
VTSWGKACQLRERDRQRPETKWADTAIEGSQRSGSKVVTKKFSANVDNVKA